MISRVIVAQLIVVEIGETVKGQYVVRRTYDLKRLPEPPRRRIVQRSWMPCFALGMIRDNNSEPSCLRPHSDRRHGQSAPRRWCPGRGCHGRRGGQRGRVRGRTYGG